MAIKASYDVIILGTGPAGLQAAIHAARKKVSVLVLGKETKSSLFHAHVENFCCLFNVSGEDMLAVGRQQAANFGADMLEEDVLSVAPADSLFRVTTESGRALDCKSLIVAGPPAINWALSVRKTFWAKASAIVSSVTPISTGVKMLP
jgi:thioredoxin reductase (NADPH)